MLRMPIEFTDQAMVFESRWEVKKTESLSGTARPPGCLATPFLSPENLTVPWVCM